MSAAERPVRWAAEVTVQELGSIGELTAAIATVATLAYFAIQIGADTSMLRARSECARDGAGKHTPSTMAQDQHLAALLHRGPADFASLSPGEVTQFTLLVSEFVSDADLAYTDMRRGINDPSSFDRTGSGTWVILNTPGGGECWRRFGDHAGSIKFPRFLESQIAASETNRPDGSPESKQRTAPTPS